MREKTPKYAGKYAEKCQICAHMQKNMRKMVKYADRYAEKCQICAHMRKMVKYAAAYAYAENGQICAHMRPHISTMPENRYLIWFLST